MSSARALLRRMFDAAINAAQPAHCLPQHLPEPPSGRTIVIGAGKASAAMAKAFEDHWPGDLGTLGPAGLPAKREPALLRAAGRGAASGIVVTRYGYAVPCREVEIVEAAH